MVLMLLGLCFKLEFELVNRLQVSLSLLNEELTLHLQSGLLLLDLSQRPTSLPSSKHNVCRPQVGIGMARMRTRGTHNCERGCSSGGTSLSMRWIKVRVGHCHTSYIADLYVSRSDVDWVVDWAVVPGQTNFKPCVHV